MFNPPLLQSKAKPCRGQGKMLPLCCPSISLASHTRMHGWKPWWSSWLCWCMAAKGAGLSPLACQAESGKSMKLCLLPSISSGGCSWVEWPQGLCPSCLA